MVTNRTLHPIVAALEKRRQSMGVTWAKLARDSSLGYNTWRAVVDGRRDPTISTLTAVAKALGCSIVLVEPTPPPDQSGVK